MSEIVNQMRMFASRHDTYEGSRLTKRVMAWADHIEKLEARITELEKPVEVDRESWGYILHKELEAENKPGEPQEDSWEEKSGRAHACWERIASRFIAKYEEIRRGNRP